MFSCGSEGEEKFRPAPLPDYTSPFNFCGEFVKDVEDLSGLAYYDGKLGIWFIETEEKAYYYICCVNNSFLHDWNVEVNYKVKFTGKVYSVKKGNTSLDKSIELLPPGITPYALDANDVKVTVFKTFTD